MSEKPILSVRDLKTYFDVTKGLFSKKQIVKAVDDVSFDVMPNETFGLVGESGCGKTTTGRVILRLYKEKTAGDILFEGKDKSPATAQEAINMLISVEEYVEKHPKIYFACKALNYRTRENKYDGNRPLAVYVDWDVQNGKMVSRLVYDTPLQQGGDYAFVKLNRAMKTLGITSAFDIGAHNVNNMGIVWNG